MTPEQQRALALARARRRRAEAEAQPAQAAQPRGVGQMLYDNVVGDTNDGVTSAGESLGTWLGRAGETMTFGLLGDEANAAAYSALPGRSYGGELERMRENEAGMSTAGKVSADLTGAILPAALGLGAVSGATSLLGAIGRGLTFGAGAGGTQGFMEGEGDASNRAVSGVVGAMLGGAIGGAVPAVGALVGRATGGQSAMRQLRDADVSIDDLKSQASALYDAARANGIVAQQPQTEALAAQVRGIATQEGLITPAGRIAESYPKLRDAINMVDDFAEGSMDPTQMQAVRRTFQDAAASADKAERRIGSMMLKAFDDFVEPLAPEFREANKLYRRAMLGEMGETAQDLAETRASQFSGSGEENALRTEFRALDRQIVKDKLRGLTPDQEAAIARVNRGGVVENRLRDVGKLAPTGVVSASLGGGMPFLIGNAMGSPALGTALGLGAMGTGIAARTAATGMARRNAEIAQLLLRSQSGTMPKAARSAAQDVIEALLFGNLGRATEEGLAQLGLSRAAAQ
jgi:hypothetical protein